MMVLMGDSLLHRKLNWPLDEKCECVCVCYWPCGTTVPNIEKLERIEKHPFLHVVINLLIGPEARRSIDLQERTRRRIKSSLRKYSFSPPHLYSPYYSTATVTIAGF